MELASEECSGGTVLQEQALEAGFGNFAVCDECGHDRRVEDFSECLFCELKSQYLVLSLEHKELLEEVKRLREGKSENEVLTLELREQVKGLRAAVEMLRQDMSVRPKDRSEGGRETLSVVEETRKLSQAGKEGSNRSQDGQGRGDGQVWQDVRGRKAGIAGKDRTETVECTNRFSVLEEEESDRGVDEETVVKDRGGKGVEDRKRASGGNTPQVCVMGDSQVRYLDSTFCGKDRGRRTNVCMPGAGVKAVSEEVQKRVREMERDGVVVLHVGGNDIRARRSQELVNRYEEMLRKIKETGRRCVVSGILPRVNASREWLSRAIGVNEQLKGVCKDVGVSFVDDWDKVFGRRELYVRDGVHLSRKGVDVLSECLERGVGMECRG